MFPSYCLWVSQNLVLLGDYVPSGNHQKAHVYAVGSYKYFRSGLVSYLLPGLQPGELCTEFLWLSRVQHPRWQSHKMEVLLEGGRCLSTEDPDTALDGGEVWWSLDPLC